MPSTAETFAQAMQYYHAGQPRVGERLCQQVLQVDPNYAEAFQLLGIIALQEGRCDEAINTIRHALTLNPSAAVFHYNLGLAYLTSRQSQKAEGCFREAIRLQPDLPESHNNLAGVLRTRGNFEEALDQCRQALELRPNYAEAHGNLGLIFAEQGKPEEALSHYRHALKLSPQYVQAHNNLGNALAHLGKLDEAVGHYRQALRMRPDYPDAHSNLGNALRQQGKLAEAVAHCQEALRLRPDFVQAQINLGVALQDQGKWESAAACFHRALRINPEMPEAHNNLGNIYEQQNKLDAALRCYEEALRLRPTFAEARCNAGSALFGLGQLERAVESFREALRLRPNLATAQTNLVASANYDPDADPDVVFANHREWGQRQRELAEPAVPHHNDRSPDRVLRIGYVSPDLCQHALTRYFEPVLAQHNPQRVHVTCYAEVQVPDAVTDRLRDLAQGWRSTCNLSDSQVAQLIRDDKIDVLVDLAGHTANNRLGVFVRKPAPIQASWLGYMNTTGLAEMDYRITDEVLDPQGEPARDTEELVRLPGGMCCFAPPADSPGVAPLSALKRGHLTFGSLSTLFKLNGRVLDLWSQVLSALPTARLLMFRSTLTPSAQDRIRQQFAERGIEGERLDLRQGTVAAGYLGVYSEIDVSLDTFPCTGGVTTCESLWMGAPVLSLRGVRPASRNSTAILTRVGMSDWAVETPDEYVALAVRWAGALDELATLRAQLRDRVTATLCDAAAFTRTLEDAYRTMWHKWCAQDR